MLTNKNRQEIADMLRYDGRYGVLSKTDPAAAIAFDIGVCVKDTERLFDRLADLIENGEPDTCVYEPTESVSYWDDNDREHETNRPSEECSTFACSRCGYEMLYGEIGWFDEEPPYTPHFKRCPECGCRVVSMTLYDRVVGDGR